MSSFTESREVLPVPCAHCPAIGAKTQARCQSAKGVFTCRNHSGSRRRRDGGGLANVEWRMAKSELKRFAVGHADAKGRRHGTRHGTRRIEEVCVAAGRRERPSAWQPSAWHPTRGGRRMRKGAARGRRPGRLSLILVSVHGLLVCDRIGRIRPSV